MTITLTPDIEQALREEAARQNTTPDQLATQNLVAAFKNRRVPQTLDELKPLREPPPGKTPMEMIYGRWPGDETDEEIERRLEDLS